jgi:uncharacterized protein YceK
MRKLMLILPVALGLGGCADMTSSQRSTATGAGVGALGGAALGSLSGNAGMGALIGAGVGGASGFLIEQNR